MKITHDEPWTRYEGPRWELEEKFPHLAHILSSDGEEDLRTSPGDWCTLEIHGSCQELEGGSLDLEEGLE